jgi:O-acetylserine/cysteine efflux transporter
MSERQKGLLFALVSALFYALIPILGKVFVNSFSPLFVAFAITLIVCVLFAAITYYRQDLLHNFKNRKSIWVIPLGIFAGLGSVLAFVGLSVGKAGHAGFFFQFEAFFAAILAYLFLKEKLRRVQVAGLIVMGIGAYVFGTSLSFSFEISNLFFLGSAFLWSINSVIARNLTKHFSPFFLVFGRNFFSLFILFPLSLKYIPANLEKITIQDASGFLLYGLVVGGLILGLYFAFRYIKTAEALSFQLISPILTAGIAFYVFGEMLNIAQITGGFIILAGFYLLLQNRIK